MRRLNKFVVGVDQGSTVMFSDFQHGGAMWTGVGPRELRQVVNFSEPFAAPPAVHASLSMWDMDRNSNQRADISTDMVTAEGFVLVFRTWGDTRVARVRADWMAIGELDSEDDWDVP